MPKIDFLGMKAQAGEGGHVPNNGFGEVSDHEVALARRPPGRLASRSPVPSDFERVASAAGWRTVPAGSSTPRALRLEKGTKNYIAVVNSVRAVRHAEVEGALADALLRARVAARQTRAAPLALVFVPAASERLIRALHTYARRYFDGDAWGVLDRRGLVVVEGPGLGEIRAEPRWEESTHRSRRSNPFSDLGQWMLKVLLAGELPDDLIGAPRDRVRNASELAYVAGVSLPTAGRFVAAMRDAGFIAGRRELEVSNRELLLRAWARATPAHHEEFGARWIMRPSDPLAHLAQRLTRAGKRMEAAPRVCLGLFAAADLLGMGVVHGAPIHLYVETLDPVALRELGLLAAPEGARVDVWLRRPAHPEALFRAVVHRAGIPVGDVLQCWLDTQAYPLRGAEQAEHIFDKVIRPCLLG